MNSVTTRSHPVADSVVIQSGDPHCTVSGDPLPWDGHIAIVWRGLDGALIGWDSVHAADTMGDARDDQEVGEASARTTAGSPASACDREPW
jgi:hypothetical protein